LELAHHPWRMVITKDKPARGNVECRGRQRRSE
jgi:hypothetical protein